MIIADIHQQRLEQKVRFGDGDDGRIRLPLLQDQAVIAKQKAATTATENSVTEAQ